MTPRINGADLFVAGGRPYLIVSPEGQVNGPDGVFEGYRGCFVLPLEDLSSGRVARCDGEPVIEAAFRGDPEPVNETETLAVRIYCSASTLAITAPDPA
jgi:hypothetical protein